MRQVIPALAGALALVAVSGAAQAHDLGVFGDAYPVAEQNLVEHFLEKMAKVDWKAKQEEIARSAQQKLRNMPELGYPQATKTQTTWIDPSLTLVKDITAPVKQPDGSYVWKVMYHKGERINPLKYLHPQTLMLIFNPKDKAQKAFALAAKHAYPNNLMLLVTGGDITGLAQEIGQPVFYTTPIIAKKFDLKAVPALAGTGAGIHADYLAVTTFSPKDIADPSKAGAIIQRDWFGVEPGVMANTNAVKIADSERAQKK